jgi:hypothetical protein
MDLRRKPRQLAPLVMRIIVVTAWLEVKAAASTSLVRAAYTLVAFGFIGDILVILHNFG